MQESSDIDFYEDLKLICSDVSLFSLKLNNIIISGHFKYLHIYQRWISC